MRSKTMLAVAGLLMSTVSAACAHADEFHGLVTERAAFDLQCEAGSLTVTDLPGMAYGVRGCGQQATYVVTGASCQNPKQLTKRELRIYCTPVLDHTAADSETGVATARPETPASDDETQDGAPPPVDDPPVDDPPPPEPSSREPIAEETQPADEEAPGDAADPDSPPG
ncbi:MAG: hypothetical protein AAF721_00195 [Myxococcota bacterium]